MAGNFQKGGAGEQSSTEGQWLAILVLFAVVCAVAWIALRAQIVYSVLALEWLQIKLVEFIRGLGPVGSDILSKVQDVFHGDIEAELFPAADLYYVMDRVGAQTAIWLAAVMMLLALWVYMRMHGEGLRQHYNLSSFMAMQAKHWKVVFPGSIFDPEAGEESTAPALRPIEWMIREGVKLTKGKSEFGDLDDERATAAFAKQLGETYMGYGKMPSYAKAIAVLTVLHGRRDKRAQQLREDLATIWAKRSDAEHLPLIPSIVSMLLRPLPSRRKEYLARKVAEFSKSARKEADAKTEELLKSITQDPAVEKAFHDVAKRHAYVNTAFQAALETSRKAGGVLANAEFRWLKPLDRSLWYSLQNSGRTAFFVESAGARAHYYAERVGGGPKVDAYVAEAIEGLKGYLKKQGINDLDAYLEQQKKQQQP